MKFYNIIAAYDAAGRWRHRILPEMISQQPTEDILKTTQRSLFNNIELYKSAILMLYHLQEEDY